MVLSSFPNVIRLSGPMRRLLVAALVVGACLSPSERRDGGVSLSASAWARLDGAVQTAPSGPAVDIDADGDLDRLMVDHALAASTVWRDERAGGLALFQMPVRVALPEDLGGGVNPPSDDSDSSDPSVRTESRAGPVVAQLAGSVLAVAPVAPSSRTFSSSTPRAPPTDIRFA